MILSISLKFNKHINLEKLNSIKILYTFKNALNMFNFSPLVIQEKEKHFKSNKSLCKRRKEIK